MRSAPLLLTIVMACSGGEPPGDTDPVSGNTEPVCAITSPQPGTTGGPSLVVQARITDAESAATDLNVVLTSGIQGDLAFGTPNADGTIDLVAQDLSVSAHQLSITATDPSGDSCTESVLYTVGDPPVVIITSPTADQLIAPTADLTATASDNEDSADALVLAWSSDVDGDLGTLSPAADGTSSFTVTNLTPGDHTLTAVATDSHGQTGSATVDARVNAPPGAPLIGIDPDPAGTSDDLLAVIVSESTDLEADPVGYQYAWDINGTPSSETGDTLGNSAFIRDDVITLTVTPTDGYTDGPPDTASITIANTAPTVSFVGISPSSAQAADVLACGYDGYDDPDGDGDFSTIHWEVNGVNVGAGSLLDSSFVGADSVVCIVTPNDSVDDGPTSQSTPLIVANTAPTVTSVQVGPTGATGNDTLSCNDTGAFDADGQTVEFTYEWTVAGTVLTGETGKTLTSGFSRGQNVSCAATPTDTVDTGLTATSAPLTILNALPAVTSISLGPSEAYQTTTLVCDATGDDADPADTVQLTYSWTVGGSEVAIDSSTLDGSDFAKNAAVTCTATPYDGYDPGAESTSNTVTIANTPPGAATPVIVPVRPKNGDDLVCSVSPEANDDDGDSLTYDVRWELDGSSWSGSTATTTWPGDTIDATSTALDDTWQCFVVANDGEEDGPEAASDTAAVSQTYDIPLADVLNLDSDCGSRPYTCTGQVGFRWTDTTGNPATKVTIEMHTGINCLNPGARSAMLNGLPAGSFTLNNGDCYCGGIKGIDTFELTDISGYNPSGLNQFVFNPETCLGVDPNPAWGADVYARVIIEY